MSMLIYVEGEKLTLSKDVETVITFSIDEIRDFSTRSTSYSKTIVIVGDANNNRIFGHLFDVAIENPYDGNELNVNVNYNPLKAAECLVFRDGLQILNGVIKIDKVTIIDGVIEYECNLFGKLTGLSSSIGEGLLQDLDFSSYNHTYNSTSIIDSWSGAIGSGYYYPLIDDGRTVDGINWDVKSFKPALYVKEYIDKIFERANYSYDSAFINSDFFKKLIIPCNSDTINVEVETLFHKERFTTLYNPAHPYIIPYTSTIGTSYVSDSSGLLTYSRNGNILVRLEADVILNIDSNSTLDYDTSISIRKNGATVASTFVTTDTAGVVSKQLKVTGYTSMVSGDTLDLYVSSTLPLTGTNSVGVVRASFKGLGNPTMKFALEVGDTLPINSAIPRDIKQIDLLKSLSQMFNLMFVEDRDRDNYVKIIPYKDFYQTDYYNDWSLKHDTSKPTQVEVTSNVIGIREFTYTYKKDSDYYNEQYNKKYSAIYGQRKYDTGLEFVKDKKSIEVIFAPPVMTQYSGVNRVHMATYKLNGTTKEQMTVIPRILIRGEEPYTTTSWNIKNGITTLASPTTYGYAGHLDDLTAPTIDLLFGAPQELYFNVTAYPTGNLFNVYIDYYIAEMTDKDSRYVTLHLRLNDVDISNLDFSRIIFMNGTLYRLSKVNNYNAGGLESTKCELIKIVNLQ